MLFLEVKTFFLKNKTVVVGGDGAEKSMDYHNFNYCQSYAQAKYMTDLALYKFEKKDFEDLAYFEPFYLKGANITQANK